jgi:hypothetical protein
MMFILLLYNRIYFFYEIMARKYAPKMAYIYLGIIIINTFVNLIFLGVFEMDTINSIISSNSVTEIGNEKIILQLDHSKVQNLVQTPEEAPQEAPQGAYPEAPAPQEAVIIESKNKLDSMEEAKAESKVKNLNPLKDIHKRLLSVDKSHFPSYFQKSSIPKISDNVPVYGDKLVTFKPSFLLQNRNLPEMFIEIPQNTSIGKLTELRIAIDGADEAVKLYDSQFIKFNDVLSGIQDGTEKFYPNEAKPLMETYVDLVTKLSNQQKVMANEAINKLHQLDPKFSRDLYPIESSTSQTGIVPVPETGSGTPPGTPPAR